MIDIGKVIEDELRRQDHTVVWLARQLGCNRTYVYSIFGKQSLDTTLLLRISRILGRNFFLLYCDELDRGVLIF